MFKCAVEKICVNYFTWFNEPVNMKSVLQVTPCYDLEFDCYGISIYFKDGGSISWIYPNKDMRDYQLIRIKIELFFTGDHVEID